MFAHSVEYICIVNVLKTLNNLYAPMWLLEQCYVQLEFINPDLTFMQEYIICRLRTFN